MATYKVGYIVGSLAKASINRKLAKALVRPGARQASTLTEIPIRDLPLYSYDYDAGLSRRRRSASSRRSRRRTRVLFVTPEYNRSIPGALKNAIDWAQPALGQELVRAQALGGDRHLAGQDRHGGRAAAAAQHARLLQFAADERARGLHPVHAGPDRRRRQRRATRRRRNSSAKFIGAFQKFLDQVVLCMTALASKLTDFRAGITAIDADYVRPRLAASHLVVDAGRAAFVDTGTTHSLPNLLGALAAKGLDPRGRSTGC